MKAPIRANARSLMILALNALLLGAAIMLFWTCVSLYQQRLWEENLANIANLNQSAASNATAFIDSWDQKLDDFVQFAKRRQLTRDQVMEALEDSNSSQSRQFELIGEDYTGYLARRDESGAFIPVSYDNYAYSQLQIMIDDHDRSHEGICFAPEFTDSHTALKYFAICAHLPLENPDGQTEMYALILASQSREVLAAFNNQSVFEGLSTVLIDARGNYIVSSDDFKSDNFFQYLYVYNDLTLDERENIARQVALNGSGELFYLNAMGQDCVFRYARMAANDWYCITCVPLSSFNTPAFIINYALYAALALIITLIVDVFWLRGLNRRMQVSMQREKEASNAKSDFLSRMSHDIRTPLNGIIGMTLLAMDQPNPAKTSEYLDDIKASGDFLLGLVNDILDMSKVESGKLDLHPERYTREEFIKYVEAVIVPLCKQKGLRFVLNAPEGELPVMFDRLRVNQIFFNLLSNSVKYTPPGGQVELSWGKTMLPENRVALDFTVSDNGIGMSEAFQEHMFESFAQENIDTTVTGSGLGLSIVWNLIKLMGGTISVRSKVGEGTSFFVHLEAEISQHEERKPAALSDKGLDGLRVLVCEDNHINAKIAKALLQKWGIIVDTAENGKVALDMFAASPPETYNAILMDIRMPEMNGLDATRAIRQLNRSDSASIPIIAMTANAYDTDVKNCFDAGMNAHMSKPIQPDLLRETLARLVLR